MYISFTIHENLIFSHMIRLYCLLTPFLALASPFMESFPQQYKSHKLYKCYRSIIFNQQFTSKRPAPGTPCPSSHNGVEKPPNASWPCILETTDPPVSRSGSCCRNAHVLFNLESCLKTMFHCGRPQRIRVLDCSKHYI